MDIVEAAARFAAEDSYVASKVREAERKRLFATTAPYVNEEQAIAAKRLIGQKRGKETQLRRAAEQRAAKGEA